MTSTKLSVKMFIKIVIKIICGLCGTGLLLSYLSIYISPSTIWFIAFFGLLFQISFLLNVLLLIAWLVRRCKLMICLHLLCLFPSIFFLGNYLQLFGHTQVATANQKGVKVITYNVHDFNLRYGKSDSAYKNIASFINAQQADVVCLQEFYTSAQLTELEFSSILYQMPHKYIYSNIITDHSKYGLAIYSKYPIKMKMELPFTKTVNSAMYADIVINDQVIRFFNVHLQSVKLDLNKSTARILGNEDKGMVEIDNISQRLRKAFVKRAKQVDMLAQHIKVSPYPVVVCGDFNDTPMSYTYHKIRAQMKDAFCEAGKGMPSTMSGLFPSFRIDYLLHDPNIQCFSYRVFDLAYSDHRPIVAELVIQE